MRRSLSIMERKAQEIASVRMGYGLQDILNESIAPIQITTVKKLRSH